VAQVLPRLPVCKACNQAIDSYFGLHKWLAPVLPTTYSPSSPRERQPQASSAVVSILDLAKASSKRESTLNSSVTLSRQFGFIFRERFFLPQAEKGSCIAEFSRLLRPVGPGFLSQNPSPGFLSQGPYRL